MMLLWFSCAPQAVDLMLSPTAGAACSINTQSVDGNSLYYANVGETFIQTFRFEGSCHLHGPKVHLLANCSRIGNTGRHFITTSAESVSLAIREVQTTDSLCFIFEIERFGFSNPFGLMVTPENGQKHVAVIVKCTHM